MTISKQTTYNKVSKYCIERTPPTMQPQEFNAFVAAVVSARTAQLIDHKRAAELVESAACRAGFKSKEGVDPIQESLSILLEREAVTAGVAAANAKVGQRVWLECTVIDIDADDRNMPIAVSSDVNPSYKDAESWMWSLSSNRVIVLND